MTVVVVGGGITGLAAAYALGRAGVPTVLLERSDRLGGKVRTERVDGFLIEHGPDSFVSYRPAAVRLAGELGLAEQLIRPTEPRTVFIRTKGRFRRFPDGMGLVLPTRFMPFALSDLFSPAEKLRMGLDLVLPRDRRVGDIGVGPFLRRRLGPALVDRLAGPLIGGVYGTAIDELSLDAVVPQLRESERKHRSLLLASLADGRARRRTARGVDGAPGGTPGTAGTGAPRPLPPAPFISLTGGTQMLVDALADAVRALPSVDVRTGVEVVEVEPSLSSVTIRLANGTRAGDAAILASPAPVTAALVRGIAPDLARRLDAIPHGSTAVVNLAYREDQLPGDGVGHGFLVADDDPMTISAGTLSSRKWAGRAPDGTLLVRAFLGSRRGGVHDRSDEALIAIARADIATGLAIRGEPILSRISRFPGAMPHYTVGHLDRVAAAEAAAAAFPTLHLAGGAYRGVGIPDCIAQGFAAAEAIVARLAGERGPGADEAGTDDDRGGAQGDVDDAGAAVGAAAPIGTSVVAAGAARHVTLAALPADVRGTIVAIPTTQADELAREGLHQGTTVSVASRAPLGGPVVVRVGRARVAVDRSIAARIDVRPDRDRVDPPIHGGQA